MSEGFAEPCLWSISSWCSRSFCISVHLVPFPQEISKEHEGVSFPYLKSSLSTGSLRLVSICTSLNKEEGCHCCKDIGSTDGTSLSSINQFAEPCDVLQLAV